MQTGFKDQQFDPVEVERVLSEQVRLATLLLSNDWVVFVNVNFAMDKGKTLPELLVALKAKRSYHYFLKDSYDSFEPLNIAKSWDVAEAIPGRLKPFLQREGVVDVMPVGCFDSACVRATAEGAKKAGFGVMVDRELNITVNRQ
ncbi:hypothetical protein GZ78_08990 [Endozoicomonas numazuensis]|uniref:Uncharacterized protein n=2 Tax=Endozoicomonas numazuensis TaxID=1137799 RepID=A0A081NH70_9GAMM|nr:hypothetical protein GZ78_08990 [Endozoicomonas numazuensis]